MPVGELTLPESGPIRRRRYREDDPSASAGTVQVKSTEDPVHSTSSERSSASNVPLPSQSIQPATTPGPVQAMSDREESAPGVAKMNGGAASASSSSPSSACVASSESTVAPRRGAG